MAGKELTIKLEWENTKSFLLKEKTDGNWITIVETHENATINEVWPGIQAVCIGYFNKKVSEIGNEMKQP